MSATITVSEEVRDILKRSTITDTTLTLPGQLSRPQYDAAMKVIGGAGGKWNRSAKCHVFTRDPREALGMAVETGKAVNIQQTLQAFYTPAALAARMANLLCLNRNMRVLEPSAGEGALVEAIAVYDAQIDCYEIDDHAIKVLKEMAEQGMYVMRATKQDFLNVDPKQVGLYDAICMNPPFTRGAAIKHTLHALKFLKPSGRLVGILDAGVLFRTDKATTGFREKIESLGGTFQKLPAGSFSESSTEVATVLLQVTMPAC